MTLPAFLESRGPRLLLFGGKGGVGKTTCALSTALFRAQVQPESTVLLVSTDPAHSVADGLAGDELPPNLRICELDAGKCLQDFKALHDSTLREIADRGTFMDAKDIDQFLALSLPGLDELMAFIEISKWVRSGDYGCVIVDTAPTGHTLRLLQMPATLRQWLRALDAFLAKHRYLKKLFAGSRDRDHLDTFLEALADSIEQMESLLRDPAQCRFVPVMLAEALSIDETAQLMGELEHVHIPVTDIVLNQLHQDSFCAVCADSHRRQVALLARHLEFFSPCALWGVPLRPEEVRGVRSLSAFWLGAFPLTRAELEPCTILPDEKPAGKVRAEPVAPAALPPLSTKLILFAGKGGVGKTTLACATSLHLAEGLAGGEVLLFSADPAHSVAACMEVPVGPRPGQIRPGLSAMAIDAAQELDHLKELYHEELERFFSSVAPDADLVFDREAMERVMDLSPPGLDEVMALIEVTGLLSQGRFGLLILDAAPTGHLIRLLEMPELLDQWLKAFFGLFLKYKRLFRLPKLTQRLIEISKGLKVLRAMLTDPDRAALYAVSTLTEMALEETRDLVAACDRMGVPVPQLFLNQATLPSRDCGLCSMRNCEESRIRKKFQEAFPEANQTTVFRQRELQGLPALKRLGQALYHPVPRTVPEPIRTPADSRKLTACLES